MSKKAGKNITKARSQVQPKPYLLNEAVPLLQKVKYAKFDETVEVTLRLGVDPKHADQMVRGTVVLPHGLGKSKKVLVIAGGEKQREAEAAGADIVRRDPVRPQQRAALGGHGIEGAVPGSDVHHAVRNRG